MSINEESILNPLVGMRWLNNQIKEITEYIELKKRCNPDPFEPSCKVHFSPIFKNETKYWSISIEHLQLSDIDVNDNLEYYYLNLIQHNLSFFVIVVNNIRYYCRRTHLNQDTERSYCFEIKPFIDAQKNKNMSNKLNNLNKFTITGCSSYTSEHYTRKHLKRIQLEELPGPFKVLSGLFHKIQIFRKFAKFI